LKKLPIHGKNDNATYRKIRNDFEDRYGVLKYMATTYINASLQTEYSYYWYGGAIGLVTSQGYAGPSPCPASSSQGTFPE
jgi:hypothetical protein